MEDLRIIGRHVITFYSDGSISTERISEGVTKDIIEPIEKYVGVGSITESWTNSNCILFYGNRSRDLVGSLEPYRGKFIRIEYKGKYYPVKYGKTGTRFTTAIELVNAIKRYGEFRIGAEVRLTYDFVNKIVHLKVLD